MNLTHLDENNRPRMVDVTEKNETERVAVASGEIVMSQVAFDAIKNNEVKKGPVVQTAVVAAIMGAKRTHELIPMCHPLLLTSIKCDVEELRDEPGFSLSTTVKLAGKTGVEMEALTAVSIGLLTIYDMAKAIDKSMGIKEIKLQAKSGGKSGDFKRD